MEAVIRRRIFSEDSQYGADTGRDPGGGTFRGGRGSRPGSGVFPMSWIAGISSTRRIRAPTPPHRTTRSTAQATTIRSTPGILRPTGVTRCGGKKWRGPITATCTGEDNYDGVDTLIFSFAISPEEKREANPAIVEKLGTAAGSQLHATLAEQLTRAGVNIEGMLERLTTLGFAARPGGTGARENEDPARQVLPEWGDGDRGATSPRRDRGYPAGYRRLSLQADPAPRGFILHNVKIFFRSGYRAGVAAADPAAGQPG